MIVLIPPVALDGITRVPPEAPPPGATEVAKSAAAGVGAKLDVDGSKPAPEKRKLEAGFELVTAPSPLLLLVDTRPLKLAAAASGCEKRF